MSTDDDTPTVSRFQPILDKVEEQLAEDREREAAKGTQPPSKGQRRDPEQYTQS